jgi:hypothetical protein
VGTPQAETRPAEPSVTVGQTYEAVGNKAGNYGAASAGASPEEKIDAAVKAIREIRDEAARRRAVAALEEAARDLRDLDAVEKALRDRRREQNPAGNPPDRRP